MPKLFPYLYYSQSYPTRSGRYLAAFKKDDFEKTGFESYIGIKWEAMKRAF